MTVHLRRMYVDCRYGQLHLHTAFPSTGGFDELTPLICVPSLPGSGRMFRPLLADLGKDRSVYAPDLPGCGESDPAESPAGMSDVATALADLLDGLRLRQVDVLGYHVGALAAVELALARPQQVRRVVLMGVPLLESREREGFLSRQSASGAARELAGAVTAYAAGERLPLLRQSVLVLRPQDEFREATGRSDALLRDARRVDLECGSAGIDAKLAADTLLYTRDFLDR